MATGTQLILSHTGSGGIEHTQNDCVPKDGTNVMEGWAWKNLYYRNKIMYIYAPHPNNNWFEVMVEKTWKDMKRHLFRTVERQFLTTRNWCGNESDELALPSDPTFCYGTIQSEQKTCILYSPFKVHGSDLLSQRWLRHLFNSEKIQSDMYPKQQMCPKMAQPYMCKMGQIAPSTLFLI